MIFEELQIKLYKLLREIKNMPRREHKGHEYWEYRAKRHKHGFALFLLVLGFLWLLRDLGYIQNLPFWPLALIFFALFLLLSRT